MATTTSRSWKGERATVHGKTAKRPRSRKYSKSDRGPRPEAGTRERVWVGGYTRRDGVRVEGHYRAA